MSQRTHRHYEYVPDAGQQIYFHAAREIYFARGVICGTGAGKTVSGLAEAISWAKNYPGSVGYIFEPSFPMVRRILLKTLERPLLLGNPITACPDVLKFNAANMRVDWRNGSEWWFVSLEEPENAEGANIDYAMVDEARLVRHLDVALRVIRRRLRGSDPTRNYPVGLWITTTPDAPRSELHSFLENPKTKHPESRVFRWSIYDNPHLTERYIRDIVRSHHGGLAERFVWGRFAAVGAGTIPFDAAVHVTSIINKKIFVQMVYGVDFGWNNPSCVLAVGFDRDGRAYVVEEYYEARVTEDKVLEVLRDMISRWGSGRVYCDPTQLQTINWLKSHHINAQKSLPKRDEGIRHMAGYFPKAGDGRPRILIHSNCVNLIAELQVYDETKKEFDHAVDTLRYGLGSRMKKEGEHDAWILG